MPDFLLEIGTEEIPARMLDSAREELKTRILDLLTRERLRGAQCAAAGFSTPRRLAVLVRDLLSAQPDAEDTVQGPAVKVAYKNGAPTAAAEAFAKRVGKSVADLTTVTTSKGEYLSATVTQKGRSAKEVLGEALPKEISAIYWAKNMYWRAGKPERFVRPVKWVLALLDSNVVPFTFAGIHAANKSRGHRVLAAESQYTIASAADYVDTMQRAGVIPDASARRAQIQTAISQLASGKNLHVREDAVLLDTVTNLVESPSAVLGTFESEYLKLPEEVLVTVMRDHQKYFAVEDASGRLAPHFIAVLNTRLDAQGESVVAHGNERVLRARFNDARFFWNTDQQVPLMERGTMLEHVTFQKDLGSYAAKTERMRRLVTWMAQQIPDVDTGAAETAATLAKADLTTELVKEFTELQGIVGGLYARAQGHAEPVALAIYDQYKPLSVELEAPRSREGALVSIADKADSIAGMFAIGLIPSGSKDPFALRRAANGIVKTMAAHNLPLTLSALMNAAFHTYDNTEAHARFRVSELDFERSVAEFFRERLEFYLRDVLAFSYDVVNAVLAVDFQSVTDAVLRAQAVAEIKAGATADFEAVSLSFKRIKNILRQAAEKGVAVAADFNPSALREPQEQQLAAAVAQASAKVRSSLEQRDYKAALWHIASIRPSLDLFFDKVMVMVEDAALRAQRLALLATIIAEFSTIADFSEIVSASS